MSRPAAQPVGAPSRAHEDPWDSFGWLMWAPWMIFLIFPVLSSINEPSVPGQTLGLLGTTTFALLYVRAYRSLSGAPPAQSWWGTPESSVVALTALVLAVATVIGLEALSFMPFLIAFGVFALRRPVNWWWSGMLLTLSLILPVVIDPGDSGWLFLLFILFAVTLSAGAGRVMVDRSAAYEAVRDELTVTTERDRVARDVHDVLGHSLTVISVKAELAARLIDADPERAGAELVAIQQLSRQALAEIRSTVGGLRAARLDVELTAAAGALAAAGIAAQMPEDSGVLDPRRRTIAAWVLREGVTNVVRHSGARHCQVRLSQAGLCIDDDGHGIDGSSAGNGLTGLQERVTETGGCLLIGAREQGGTRLEVTW